MNLELLENLFNIIKSESNNILWSKGVSLSRENKILLKKSSPEEHIFIIRDQEFGISVETKIWIEEEDWQCQCVSNEDPCFHVIAVVILAKKLKGQWTSIQSQNESLIPISYKFYEKKGFLQIKRVYSSPDNREINIIGSIKITSKFPSNIQITNLDMELDTLLMNLRESPIPSTSIKKIFKLLIDCEQVFFDNQKIRTDTREVQPKIHIQDEFDGCKVQYITTNQNNRFFKNSVLLEDGSRLKFKGENKFQTDEFKWLNSGKIFLKYDLGFLAGEIIPKLEKFADIEIDSKNFPEKVNLNPEVLFETDKKGDYLKVTPKLVYGNPQAAFIQSKSLVLVDNECPIRNYAKEYKLIDRLNSELQMSPEITFEYEGIAAIQQMDKISKWGSSVIGTGKNSFQQYEPLIPNLTILEDNLDISFELDYEETIEESRDKKLLLSANPEDVFNAWERKASLVPLIGGGFAPPPKDWLNKYGTQLKALFEAKSTNEGKVPKPLWPVLKELCDDLSIKPSSNILNFDHLLKKETQSFSMPSDLNANLRPYQKEGIHWLAKRQNLEVGALLSDDMGLGKTLQSICIIKGRVLIVSPTSVLFNWHKELKKFRPNLKASIYHGPRRKVPDSINIILTTYGTLRNDLEKLAKINFDTIILDEAQTIKNPKSKISHAVFTLKGQFRLALTGTPIENSLEDLWSQFNFINRGLLGSYQSFQKKFTGENINPETLGYIRKSITPYILRRTKKEVLKDLPEKIETEIFCELSQKERDVYNSIYAISKKEIQAKLTEKDKFLEVLEIILRLRQACCHLALLPNQNEKEESSSKIDLLVDKLTEIKKSGGKSLVFSQWTKFLDLIENKLNKKSFNLCRLDGSTRNREQVVEKFQTDENIDLMLVSLKAGSTGINLTAAEYVFIMDPWWNPAVENQAADRAHRIGQKKLVQVFKMVTINTIEKNILKLQQKKKNLSDAILLDDINDTRKLSSEDLLSLFD